MDSVARIRQYLATSNRSFVQANNLVEKISRKTMLQRDEVLAGLAALKDAGEIACNDWFRGEPLGRVSLSLVKITSESIQTFKDELQEWGLPDSEVMALSPLGDMLSTWSLEDRHLLVNGLIELRANLPALAGQSRYAISSQYLMGSSKLLDALPWSILRAFGIDPATLAPPPSYVIAAGPAQPYSVVLVENPQAMETALRVKECEDIAWIATFGYGLSRIDNEYGNQLASVIESGAGLTTLVRAGNPPPVQTLLQHDKLYFWGDLDREGLRIFWRLKSALPQLELSGLYRPMLASISRLGRNHGYIREAGKLKQKEWVCDDAVVSRLLAACNRRAVDQESLIYKDFADFAGKSFL